MGRPAIARAVKRARLRALDMATEVPGQLTPSCVESIANACGQKPKSIVAEPSPKKTTRSKKKVARG